MPPRKLLLLIRILLVYTLLLHIGSCHLVLTNVGMLIVFTGDLCVCFRASNHSLGVGWNKFSLYLIDTGQSNPVKVVNTYDVFVFRKRRSETENAFDKDSSHQVCIHHQVRFF